MPWWTAPQTPSIRAHPPRTAESAMPASRWGRTSGTWETKRWSLVRQAVTQVEGHPCQSLHLHTSAQHASQHASERVACMQVGKWAAWPMPLTTVMQNATRKVTRTSCARLHSSAATPSREIKGVQSVGCRNSSKRCKEPNQQHYECNLHTAHGCAPAVEAKACPPDSPNQSPIPELPKGPTQVVMMSRQTRDSNGG